MAITSDWYRYFCSIAETGSFTRGAGTLGITQSAISQGIKNLESHIGTALFVRNRKGAVLTAEGARLLVYVREAFRLLSLGEMEIWEHTTLQKGRIVLGAGDTVCKYFLLPQIREFHKSYPGIRISIINRTSMELLQLLESGDIDIGIVAAGNLSDLKHSAGIVRKRLFEIEDCFACSPSLDPPASKNTAHTFLPRHPLLLPSPKTATRKHLENFFRQAGIMANEVIDFESVDLQLEFAVIGTGIAYAPIESMKNLLTTGQLVQLPLSVTIPPRQTWAVYHRRPSTRVQKFLEVL